MQTAYMYFYLKTWKLKAASIMHVIVLSLSTQRTNQLPLGTRFTPTQVKWNHSPWGQLCVSHPTMSSSKSLSLAGIRQLQYSFSDTVSLTVSESCCMWRVSSSGITHCLKNAHNLCTMSDTKASSRGTPTITHATDVHTTKSHMNKLWTYVCNCAWA